MPTSEQLAQYLRKTLDRLYEPDKLRDSPLAAILGVADRVDTPLLLRQILVDAVESLKPDPNIPYHSPLWRAYEVLLYRYIQQFDQQEVADQLGLSVRHLRREQEAALARLAIHIWTEFQLGAESGLDERESEPLPVGSQVRSPSVNEELPWLGDPSRREPADIIDELSQVSQLLAPLADQYQVDLEVSTPDPLPELAIHPTALRQALLSLLTVAIHRTGGGRIVISAKVVQGEVAIEVLSSGLDPGARPVTEDEAVSLDMARRLVTLFDGSLSPPSDDQPFAASLSLPALGQVPVLAIDDNEDTLQLFTRYTLGTRYRLAGTRDPETVLSLARDVSPRIILLDVMMPGVDGWELLGRLRHHPATGHIPIVVCTVLTQRELALSLGASDLLRKPVTRQAFLETLDQQMSKTASESDR
jgi:CheY-like chemotaxis protein